MHRPRFRIRALMIVVAVVAALMGLVRLLFGPEGLIALGPLLAVAAAISLFPAALFYGFFGGIAWIALAAEGIVERRRRSRSATKPGSGGPTTGSCGGCGPMRWVDADRGGERG